MELGIIRILSNITQNLYSNAINEVEHRPNFECIKDTQYLTLMGKLWNVYCESFGKYWLRYNTNAVNGVEHRPDFECTNDLTFMSKLWDIIMSLLVDIDWAMILVIIPLHLMR